MLKSTSRRPVGIFFVLFYVFTLVCVAFFFKKRYNEKNFFAHTRTYIGGFMIFFRLLGADTLSIPEKWATSGITTLLGLGTTFIVLALLIGLIALLRLILQRLEKLPKKNKKVSPAVEAVATPSENISADKPIDEDTLSAIEKAVMNFVKKEDNVVIVKSVSRAGKTITNETDAVLSRAAAPVQESAATVSGNGSLLKAPMPGTVLKIKAANGSHVEKDRVLFVLEAMKMENDIVASASGTFRAKVSEGASVNTGDVLAEIV